MFLRITRSVSMLAATVLAVGGWEAKAAGLTGAIFTTFSDGSRVNANQYDSKCSVYLDGGPGPNAPAKAAGLPDGDYYFQVTDPSGKVLLSTDPVSNRRFRVTGGVITAYTGTGGSFHPTGIDRDQSALGAITIRLGNSTCPADFLDSPNNGDVYKVWATKVGDFKGDPSKVDSPCDKNCYHGFEPSKSKTDNFKAKPTPTSLPTFCLTLHKEMQQVNGTLLPEPNWAFTILDPLGVSTAVFTDTAGQVQVCGLAEGAYTVSEQLKENESVIGLIVNGTLLPAEPMYSFTWTAGKVEPVVLFQNTRNTPQ